MMKRLVLATLLLAGPTAHADILKLTRSAQRQSPLDGVWYRHTKGIHGYKTLFNGRIHVTQVDERSGLIVNQFVGVFAVKDGHLHERAIACSAKWNSMKGEPRRYRLEVAPDGDRFTMIYPNGNREDWYRSK